MASTNVLGKYRTLLNLIKRLPEPLRTTELTAARNAFRENAHVGFSQVEADLLQTKLDDKLRYLRIVTPKRPGDASVGEASTVYVVRDGRLEASSGRRERRVADGRINMAEAHERHEKLLRRQHFGRKPPAYDPSTF